MAYDVIPYIPVPPSMQEVVPRRAMEWLSARGWHPSVTDPRNNEPLFHHEGQFLHWYEAVALETVDFLNVGR